MDTQKKNMSKLILSVTFLLVSVFMATSYHFEIGSGADESLTETAYYVWICFAFLSLLAGIHFFKKIREKGGE